VAGEGGGFDVLRKKKGKLEIKKNFEFK